MANDGAGAFFSSGVFDGVHFWLVPYGANGVLRVTASSKATAAFKQFPIAFDADTRRCKFSGGVLVGRQLFLVPACAPRVVVVDVDTGNMTALPPLPDGIASSAPGAENFAGGTFDGQRIWLAPAAARAVVTIEMADTAADLGVVSLDGVINGTEAGNATKFGGAVHADGTVWLVPGAMKRLLAFNVSTGALVHDGASSVAARGAGFDGRFLTFGPSVAGTTSVVRFDTLRRTETTLPPMGLAPAAWTPSYSQGWYDGAATWLAPQSARHVLREDGLGNVAAAFSMHDPTTAGWAFSGAVTDGATLWLVPKDVLTVPLVRLRNSTPTRRW